MGYNGTSKVEPCLIIYRQCDPDGYNMLQNIQAAVGVQFVRFHLGNNDALRAGRAFPSSSFLPNLPAACMFFFFLYVSQVGTTFFSSKRWWDTSVLAFLCQLQRKATFSEVGEEAALKG